MIVINNAENWWAAVRVNEEVILTLISRFHPPEGYDRCPVDTAIEAIQNLDHSALRSLLGETWFGTALIEETDAIPGIEVLCALCNEAWVLDEIAEFI